jgi:DHA3 family macrolide efflux protein-like MFS transporter
MEATRATFRNYLFFWSGQLVSLLGSSIAQFVIIWWIVTETGSALYLSLASLLGLAPIVVLSPIAGVLVDRWNRRVLIGVVDMLQALATVGLILMFWMDLAALWQVLILLFMRGIFQAFHSPATSAITPLMVPKEKLSRINGLSFLFTGAINLAGPVIAAILLEIWMIDSILWIDAFTFIVALIPLLRITIPPVREKLQKSSFKEDLIEGISFIRGRRGLLPTVIMAALLNFLLTPLSTLLPFFVKVDHFGEAQHLAFVIAVGSGGTLGGGLLMSVWKGVKKKIMSAVAAIYILFLGYALVALAPTGFFWFMAIGLLIGSFFAPMANVSIITIVQTVVPARMQGRVNSVLSATAMAAMPLGMILSGTLAEFVATSTIFLGCTVLGVLVLTLFWLLTDIRYVEEMENSLQSNSPINVDS